MTNNRSRSFLSPIGKHLRKLRIDLDLDVESMAETLGVSVSRLTRIELGKTSPDFQFAEALISVYGSPSEVWSLMGQSQTKAEFPLTGLSAADRERVFALHRELYGDELGLDTSVSGSEDPATPIEISVISAAEEVEMARIDEEDNLGDDVGFIDEDDEVPLTVGKAQSRSEAAFL